MIMGSCSFPGALNFFSVFEFRVAEGENLICNSSVIAEIAANELVAGSTGGLGADLSFSPFQFENFRRADRGDGVDSAACQR
jgi:hypothetical protein